MVSMDVPWWRHYMEIFSALLALCEGNPPVIGGFPSQRPVIQSFGVLFDLRTVEQTIEKPVICDAILHSLWRHCNASTWLVHLEVQCWTLIPGVTETSLVINDFEYVFADHMISFNMADKVSRNIAEFGGFIQPGFCKGKSIGHQWFPSHKGQLINYTKFTHISHTLSGNT